MNYEVRNKIHQLESDDDRSLAVESQLEAIA
jgi:hypothetical protein